MKMKIDQLSTTPLRQWPAEALMQEAKRAAGIWISKKPEFRNNGGLFSNEEDLASEIVARVIAYIKKRETDDNIDQVAQFHSIAKYHQPGIIQDNYAIPSVTEGVADDCDDEYVPEIADRSSEEIEDEKERAAMIADALKRVGLREADYSLFMSATKDWCEATGRSERENRLEKKRRRDEIVELIKNNPAAMSALTTAAPQLRYAIC